MNDLALKFTDISLNVGQITSKTKNSQQIDSFSQVFQNQQKEANSFQAKEKYNQIEGTFGKDAERNRARTGQMNKVEDSILDSTSQIVSDEEIEENILEQEELLSTLQSAIAEILQILSNVLEISEEEVLSALENFDMAQIDLLDLENLNEFYMNMKNIDMTTLLTDENMLSLFKELQNQFEAVIEKIDNFENVEDFDNLIQLDEVPLFNQLKQEDTMESDRSSQNSNSLFETINISDTTSPIQQYSFEENLNKDAKNSQENDESSVITTLNIENQNFLESDFLIQTKAALEENIGTNDIMEQILDYMKFSDNGELSQLEMQLQPENLGTLQVRISAKEGIMTAQFSVSNENVKNILEAQMVQLQEKFVQQDIKVEAIEVTLQAHQFESNLQQRDEGTKEEAKKEKIRKIDISQLEEGDELSEEETIISEMMRLNGNTLDYLV